MNLTIYIQKANWDQLQNEPKKSELINRLLTIHYGGGAVQLPPATKRETPETPAVEHTVYTRQEPFVPKPPDPELGYDCCQRDTPCKHWQWDANRTLYVNSLTGKTKEAAL